MEIIAEAKAMLDELDGRYRTTAMFALCDAKGNGDNIIIEGTTLPLLRQQHSTDGKYNLCLSDFVSPHGDRIGLFATSVESEFGKEYAGDEYKNLLAQTLADRLAEATATLLHKQVRTDNTLWGYSPGEELTLEELLAERNQGIRPAVGYPSLPDLSLNFDLDGVIDFGEIGISLTENGMMSPQASVSGLLFAHPLAQHFAVGKIGDDQLADYASRRGQTLADIRRYLKH
jgi:cobalamin-dependent methionine synthase I